jgi:perosamine synthetase
VETGMLAVGPAIGALEQRMSERMGGRHTVAVQSGTAALHLALLAAGVQDDDLVIVPEATFVATVNAICYCNAHPLLADVDPDTGLLDIDGMSEFLNTECEIRDDVTVDRKTGRIVRAIVPVHLYGHPVDMDMLVLALKPHAITIIEDAAESLGASYRGRPVGGLGDTSILSFNGNKIITGGAGGMIVTANEDLAARCRYLASQARDDALYFLHNEVGFNYRMPNLNAALILAQMDSLDSFVERKRAVAKSYGEKFTNAPGLTMAPEAAWAESSNWMSVLHLNRDIYPNGAEPVIRTLNERQIGARPTWIPLGDLPPHVKARRIDGNGAQRYTENTICLPCSTSISDEEINSVVHETLDVLRASRA